jgi:hypothetical protein
MNKLLSTIKHWLWDKPISKPEPEKPIRLKATEVLKEYMVVTYHGQRINLHISKYPLWKTADRKTKRAIKDRFAKQERQGLIRWEEIEGKLICIKNKNYNPK